MRRDGENVSIWQKVNIAQIESKPTPTHVDVVIIGAGITGLTSALSLQTAGKSCLLLDAHGLGFGTTGGTSAHLNTVLDTPYHQIIDLHGKSKTLEVVNSAREAINIIEKNIKRYNIDCDYRRCSGIMYAQDDGECKDLNAIYSSLLQLNIPAQKIANNLPDQVMEAIRFGGQAHFHPTKYLSGLLNAYLEAGGLVLEQALVTQVKEDNGLGVEIITSDERVFSANYAVYATHTPIGLNPLQLRIAPYRSYIQVWEINKEQYFPDHLVYDLKQPFHYFRKVMSDGKVYLMVGGQDHKTADEDDEQENFNKLESFIKSSFTVGVKSHQWSSQFYESQDHLPYIGFTPGGSGSRVLLATGFGGNGMIFGTLAAKMMADLIIKGSCQYQELYSPDRIGPLKSYKDFVKENANVAKHFILDRFSYEKLDDKDKVEIGEGKLVKLEGRKIGLSRSYSGDLIAVDPVCKHAGCIVKWNGAEQTWDCPCHGARYAPNGTVLTGPSTENLQQIQLSDTEDTQ